MSGFNHRGTARKTIQIGWSDAAALPSSVGEVAQGIIPLAILGVLPDADAGVSSSQFRLVANPQKRRTGAGQWRAMSNASAPAGPNLEEVSEPAKSSASLPVPGCLLAGGFQPTGQQVGLQYLARVNSGQGLRTWHAHEQAWSKMDGVMPAYRGKAEALPQRPTDVVAVRQGRGGLVLHVPRRQYAA